MPIPALIGLAGGALNYAASSYMQDRQNEQTRQNMRLASEQSMANVQEQPLRLVHGLKAAGLNPALASQSGFSAPSVASHPGASPSNISPFSLEAVQAFNQSKVADAEARKINAEASGIELENVRRLDEDLTFDANIVQYLKESNNPMAQVLLDSGEIFTKGTFSSLRDFEQFRSALDDADTRRLANEVSRLVSTAQKSSPYYSAALAEMPYRQLNSLIYSTLKMQEETANLIQERDVNDSRIKEILSHIALMASQTSDVDYNNVVKLWKTRDYQGLVIKGVQAVLGLAGEGAKAYTFGKAAVGKRALGVLKEANPDYGGYKGPFPHPEGYRRY